MGEGGLWGWGRDRVDWSRLGQQGQRILFLRRYFIPDKTSGSCRVEKGGGGGGGGRKRDGIGSGNNYLTSGN